MIWCIIVPRTYAQDEKYFKHNALIKENSKYKIAFNDLNLNKFENFVCKRIYELQQYNLKR